tara:strand:- start:16 stop:780 length:765 start_codon:yes stop_codon:yes gene_type:complete
MIKFLTYIFLIIVSFNTAFARNAGETEITTDEGIEVFQNEKFYLLKKNVEIISDEFNLKGQIVKIFFEKDLYDIKEIEAHDNVTFDSKINQINGYGENVHIKMDKEEITINGDDSKLFLDKSEMYSDGKIIVNNLKGSFFINGLESKLISDEIFMSGYKIDGIFEMIDNKRNISKLIVEDDEEINIKTDNVSMFSKKAIYNKADSIIELFEDVKIIRGNEIITGNYGIFNTKQKSYKVSSNKNKKVKAILLNAN